MGPFTVRLGQGGRITLPEVVRRALGLLPGSAVTLIPGARGRLRLVKGAQHPGTWGPGGVLLSPVRRATQASPQERWKRAVKHHGGAMTSLTREPADTQAQVMRLLLEPYIISGHLDAHRIERLLGPVATSRPIRVIVADGRAPVRLETGWWRFRDDSRLVVVVRFRHDPLVEETDGDGLGRVVMVDHPRAIRAALRSDHPKLVEAYIRCHGTLPRLDQELLLLALESPSSAVRPAAIASLSRSASPPEDENGAVAGAGSLPGDRHPDLDRGSVAGAAPADIPVGPDQAADVPGGTPAPEAP